MKNMVSCNAASKVTMLSMGSLELLLRASGDHAEHGQLGAASQGECLHSTGRYIWLRLRTVKIYGLDTN